LACVTDCNDSPLIASIPPPDPLGYAQADPKPLPLHPHATMADIETLALQIIAEDRRLKIETKRLEALKNDLLGMMESENVGEVNVKEGRIIRCARTTKDFGEVIKNLEANLKAEKARAEYLGQYIIKSVTNYLRVG
jgi:septum formation topological specificity factor MinE